MNSECIFCQIVNGKTPCYKVYEDDIVIAFFDISIGNDFHTLVIPKNHTKDIFNISSNDLQAVSKATQKNCPSL